MKQPTRWSAGVVLDRVLAAVARRKGRLARSLTLTLAAIGLFFGAVVGINIRWPVQRDCADVLMLVTARGLSADDARATYQCFSPEGQFGRFRATLSEEAFVAQFASPNTDPTGRRLERVARVSTPDGGAVVFFVVRDARRAVGYVVTLDSQGKAVSVE